MAAVTSTIPTRCIERHPTSQTVAFCGCNINLSRIAEFYEPKLDHGYLSKIFKGTRIPSYDYMERIAEALGMTMGSFVEALKARRQSAA